MNKQGSKAATQSHEKSLDTSLEDNNAGKILNFSNKYKLMSSYIFGKKINSNYNNFYSQNLKTCIHSIIINHINIAL